MAPFDVVDKKWGNGYISAPEPKLKKTKGTLFSQTLKVEGNKVPLVFSIFVQGPR